jgi:hypothetical protein
MMRTPGSSVQRAGEGDPMITKLAYDRPRRHRRAPRAESIPVNMANIVRATLSFCQGHCQWRRSPPLPTCGAPFALHPSLLLMIVRQRLDIRGVPCLTRSCPRRFHPWDATDACVLDLGKVGRLTDVDLVAHVVLFLPIILQWMWCPARSGSRLIPHPLGWLSWKQVGSDPRRRYRR